MDNKSTHIVFDGKKIIVSPDIVIVFEFLIEIEKEIESLLGFEKKLDSIKKQYLELLNLTIFLSKELKDNNIDSDFTFSENPATIADKLKLHLPVCSQMIVLFANLEVLFCLNISYQKETDNDKEIINFAMTDKIVKEFLNSYFLVDKNKYYKQNEKRFSKISAQQIRYLRNYLAHFFSVGSDISITPSVLNNKARKLEKIFKEQKQNNSIFISPEDLYELIKEATILMIKEWNNDFVNDQQKFKRRILLVQSVVKKNAAVIIPSKNLNL
ncbi:MAG: hypothetical protein GWO87_03265 [Xanthomonadaceae bacterium]|nr:hypothetical protein [Rhodospirillaceae bacterium]NIA18181.1 hypothetical protein [Xanthomonadaceae bacterium]